MSRTYLCRILIGGAYFDQSCNFHRLWNVYAEFASNGCSNTVVLTMDEQPSMFSVKVKAKYIHCHVRIINTWYIQSFTAYDHGWETVSQLFEKKHATTQGWSNVGLFHVPLNSVHNIAMHWCEQAAGLIYQTLIQGLVNQGGNCRLQGLSILCLLKIVISRALWHLAFCSEQRTVVCDQKR